MSKRQFIVTLFLLFLLFGCENRYNCFYYPEGTSGKWIPSPIFSNRKEALNWCSQEIGKSEDSSEECECGKNCKTDESGLQVCEETF